MNFNKIFITVGTTKFNELIECIENEKIANILINQLKCKQLTVQIGNGVNYFNDNSTNAYNNINLNIYDYKSSIKNDIDNANLVISHAGAGSCMEILNAKKPLIVVVNEMLMDNHQIELAKQLSNDGYLFFCTINTLYDTLLNLNINQLKAYEPGTTKNFLNYLDKLMGFSS